MKYTFNWLSAVPFSFFLFAAASEAVVEYCLEDLEVMYYTTKLECGTMGNVRQLDLKDEKYQRSFKLFQSEASSQRESDIKWAAKHMLNMSDLEAAFVYSWLMDRYPLLPPDKAKTD